MKQRIVAGSNRMGYRLETRVAPDQLWRITGDTTPAIIIAVGRGLLCAIDLWISDIPGISKP